MEKLITLVIFFLRVFSNQGKVQRKEKVTEAKPSRSVRFAIIIFVSSLFSISFGSIPYRPASFIILLSSLGCACLSMVALLIPFNSYIFKLMHSLCLFLDPWIGCFRRLLASFWTFWVLGAQFLISVDLVCHAVVATLVFQEALRKSHNSCCPVHSCGRDLAQHRWAPLRLKGSQSPEDGSPHFDM